MVVHTSSPGCAKPIIGPPDIIFETSLFVDSQNVSSSAYDVPSRTKTFFGDVTGVPVTVVTRSVTGLPLIIASWIASVVPTFSTTQPTSIGSPADGTSLPVMANICCFSAPCGYSVFRMAISTSPSISANALPIASIASGLLDSIATLTVFTESILLMISIPVLISAAYSTISLWSAVR